MANKILCSLLILITFALSLGCEGCEQTDRRSDCPDETTGDVFILLDRIEAGNITCMSAEFPDANTWMNIDVFTNEASDATKYYAKIRFDGFCDNIGKTDPFTVIRDEVDGIDLIPVVVNNRKGFRINGIPINRQLWINLWIREPCNELPCGFCEIDNGQKDHRIRFFGMSTVFNVINLDVVELTIFAKEELCDCEV